MGWLLGYTLGSIAASFVVVRAFDFLVGGSVDSATNSARGSVFVNTWAAVTAKSGMRDLSKSAQKLRLKNLVAKDKIDALVDDEPKNKEY